MDSQKSLAFITELIKQAKTNPEVRAVLKKATLMNRTAEVLSGIDDGHLENLYAMNKNRGGAAMFLKAVEKASSGKAPKGVVIQSHPNFIRDFQKFFPATVPFAVTSLEHTVIHWDEASETKQSNKPQGFYNDMPSLIAYLQKVGLQAPFEIKAGKNSLELISKKTDKDQKRLLAEMLGDAQSLSDAMTNEEAELEHLDVLRDKITELESELREAQLSVQQKEKEHKVLRANATRIEQQLSSTPPKMNGEDNEAWIQMEKDWKKSSEKANKAFKDYRKQKDSAEKVKGLLSQARVQFRQLYDASDKDRLKMWQSLDWQGGTPSEDQIHKLIYMLGERYRPLLDGLPKDETITVNISCSLKSSSKGYKEGTFKHLSDFIKFSIF